METKVVDLRHREPFYFMGHACVVLLLLKFVGEVLCPALFRSLLLRHDGGAGLRRRWLVLKLHGVSCGVILGDEPFNI